jgi:hypothetical protein
VKMQMKMQMKKIIAIVLLASMFGCEAPKKPAYTKGIRNTTSVSTVSHEGCLFVLAESARGLSIIHHPRCTNHETKFR